MAGTRHRRSMWTRQAEAASSVKRLITIASPGGKTEEFWEFPSALPMSIPSSHRVYRVQYGSHKGNLGIRNPRNLLLPTDYGKIFTSNLNLHPFFLLPLSVRLFPCRESRLEEEEGQKYKNLAKHGRGGKSWAGRQATMEYPARASHPYLATVQ